MSQSLYRVLRREIGRYLFMSILSEGLGMKIMFRSLMGLS